MKENDGKYTIQSVDRALRIFDFFCSSESTVSLTEICESLSLNSNMAYRLLMTMRDSGYLVQDQDTNKFRLSLKVLQLTRNALSTLEIRTRALPYLERLWQEYPKTNINLGLLHNGEVLVISRIESEHVPRTHFTAGKVMPVHSTALGKSLICELDESDIRKIVETRGLRPYTENTITDGEELLRQVRKARTDQVTWDYSENVPNDNCVAAPVRDASRKIIAAVSLSAFTAYMTIEELETAAIRVRETARSISYAMGFDN
ncbi:MAG TPA: IclR family transcriptional regulator [Spirochaetia bacterium]|nr:IclR family transcriptional regulator [Spirochaetia bacterium]